MNMNKIVLYIGLVTCLLGCRIYGINSAYKYFQKDNVPSSGFVFEIENGVPNSPNPNKIYTLNADQVKQILASKDSSVLYFWSPRCHSSACLPLSTFEQHCSDNGYTPIIVAEYYDYDNFLAQHHESNLYILDYDYYQTQKTGKCATNFFKELLGEKYDKDNYYRYFIFRGKEFLYSQQVF